MDSIYTDEFGDWTERQWRELFPAQITSVTNSSGTFLYSWSEQLPAGGANTYEAALGGRTGNSTSAWALEINNKEVAVNTVVWMRFRCIGTGSSDPVYEFVAPDASAVNTTISTNTTYTNTTITHSNTTTYYNTNSVVNVANTSTYNFQAGSTIIFGGPSINMTANTSITLSAATVLTITGGSKVVYETPVEICGYLFYCYQTESAFVANQDDWTGPSFAGAEAVVYRISSTTPVDLTGMVAEADGQVVCLVNVDIYDITLKHEAAGSTAANRFALPDAADIVLGQHAAAICWYDPIDTRWKVLATSGAPAILGTGAGLADPGADRILFWDDSASSLEWLEVGTGLSITGTVLTASATVAGSGGTPYYSYWTAANELASGSIAYNGNYNESASTFRVGAGTVNSHYYLAVYGDTTGNKALYSYVAGADGFISLDSTGFYDSSVANPYPGDLTLQLGAANTECILIGGPMSQTRFCTYDGPGTGVKTGASGTIGPGAAAFGGIVYDAGTGSMGTVTSITPGSGLTGTSNPITNTGTLSLTFKGPYKWGVE